MICRNGFTLVENWVSGGEHTQYIGGYARFESNDSTKRFINISTAPLRLELDLDFGKESNQYTIFELCELESCQDFPIRKHNLYESINDKDLMCDDFLQLVEYLLRYGNRFFKNDQKLWNELSQQREEHYKLSKDQTLTSDAEKAFKQQRWDEVIKILESVTQKLSKLNTARLKYAYKHRDCT